MSSQVIDFHETITIVKIVHKFNWCLVPLAVVVSRGTVKFPTISLKTGFLLAFISDTDSKSS
ncbi:MAG TPA: hypothetical protein VIW25_00320 [Nitrososphaeraceae archaeon]|jgi:hypothetical protein